MSATAPAATLDDLNGVQRDAVVHGDGPALVVAGAGSGKTRVLTRRIAHLIGEKGVDPGSILAITFTNKAAEEMRARVGALVGQLVRGMWISTFHRACVRILRRDAERIGYPRNFTIYDQADSRRLTKYVLADLGFDPKRFIPRAIHQQISTRKNLLQSVEFVAESAEGPADERLARVYAEYQRRIQAAGAMDFDDLLTQTEHLLSSHPDVLGRYQKQFAHILVDEYQDTNPAQNALVLLLGRAHKNVFVVGDTDQSIYAFRGADIRNIWEFNVAFDDCATYVLEQNYRSTKVILDAANSLIANNEARVPKNLWTEAGVGAPIVRYRGDDDRDEARFIAEQVQKLCRGIGLGDGADGDDTEDPVTPADIAVFYRSNSQSRVIEEAFVTDGIAYKVVGGTRFYD
ncbi:MAG TPA: ATP-dependent DNA helicase PcrA, partial [Acidimicrobiaceae bacterium]|nr:ATP-dependent DNA helicase PcrA [Acidimicrobiaceae bacterium]